MPKQFSTFKENQAQTVDGFKIGTSDNVFQSPTLAAQGIRSEKVYISFNDATVEDLQKMRDALIKHLAAATEEPVALSGVRVEGMGMSGTCRIYAVVKTHGHPVPPYMAKRAG
jgi:hypothetical protein